VTTTFKVQGIISPMISDPSDRVKRQLTVTRERLDGTRTNPLTIFSLGATRCS
jgi:hypothetical protein